jgi:hypothetical protein
MKNKPRKGLQDIPTRSSLTRETQNPQRRFLRVASLELKKSLCEKVRDAASRRAGEMDEKIAELEAEKARLLGEDRVASRGERFPTPSPPSAADPRSEQPCGFTLRY